MSNSVRQCVRQHTQALYGVQDLYNLPNFNRAPDFGRPNGPLKLFFLHNNCGKLIDNWFYKNRKNHVTSDASANSWSSLRPRMRNRPSMVHLGALHCLTHFTVVGGVPFVMSARHAETIVRQALSSQYLALLSSFLYACYVFTVHPVPGRPSCLASAETAATSGTARSTAESRRLAR